MQTYTYATNRDPAPQHLRIDSLHNQFSALPIPCGLTAHVQVNGIDTVTHLRGNRHWLHRHLRKLTWTTVANMAHGPLVKHATWWQPLGLCSLTSVTQPSAIRKPHFPSQNPHKNKQDWLCTYKPAMKRVHVTIVAVEKQWMLHIFSVCL